MEGTSAEIEQILTLLAETPQRLATLTDGIEASLLHSKVGEDAWSVNDILAHLRSCADIWGQSITAMIAQDHPRLAYVSPRTWQRETDYLKQDFRLSLQTYTQQRQALLSALSALAVEDWSRGATFKTAKKERKQTVFDYARRIAHHEGQHIEQVELVLYTIQTQLS